MAELRQDVGYDFTLEDREARVLPSRKDGCLGLEIEGRRLRARLEPGSRSGEWTLLLDAAREPIFLASSGDVHFVHWRGRTHRVEARNALEQARAQASRAGGTEAILAPMPGVVVSVAVAVGDVVEAGALLLTIESMKLQTAITTGHAARVEALCVVAGENFDQGRALVRLGPVAGVGTEGTSAPAERPSHAAPEAKANAKPGAKAPPKARAEAGSDPRPRTRRG